MLACGITIQRSFRPPSSPFYSKYDATIHQAPWIILFLRISFRVLLAYCLSIAATSSSILSIASPPRAGKSSAAVLSFLFLAELPLPLLLPWLYEPDERLARRSDPA